MERDANQSREEFSVQPAWLARLLGWPDVRFSLREDGLFVETGKNDGFTILVESLLGESRVRRWGGFLAALELVTSGGTRRISGLSPKVAKAALSRIQRHWYMLLDEEFAPRVADLSRALESGYLRTSKWNGMQRSARDAVARFRKIPPQGLIPDESRKRLAFLVKLSKMDNSGVEALRRRYVQAQKQEYATYFDQIESNPLTENQREACIVDEDNNLVLAGAGTGKTSVMVGRVGFLLKSGLATPERILMLAYGNQAAKEMRERIADRLAMGNVTASTFHSLGQTILASVEGKKPSLTPMADDNNLFRKKVDQWFTHLLEDKTYKSRVLKYFEHFLFPAKNPFDFVNEGEYFEFLIANEIRSLKGEPVKSYQECLIANYLFKQGVEYEYEAPYEIDTRTPDFRQYHPDFYLPEVGIYLEHFGVDRDGKTAPWVDAEKYQRGMQWKRQLHAKHETALIESYHYDWTEGELEKRLASKLMEAGVEFAPLPDDAVLKTLREFGAIDNFSRILADLISLYKANWLDEHALQYKIEAADDPEQMRAALEVMRPIYEEYQSELNTKQQIDFHDMIGRALDYVKSDKYRSPWKYILVDEFQDISDPRARLVLGLRDNTQDCSVFCVGDDWQAIYRFAGSDISYTTEFAQIFGATKTTRLDKTFRFNNSICDIASRFVMRNPQQVRKNITTHSIVTRPMVSLLRQSHRNEPDEESPVGRALAAIARVESENASIFILSRFKFHLPDRRDGEQANRKAFENFRRNHPGLTISCDSIHGSKGRQADYVIVLGLETGKHGFPSEKVTNPLLDAMLPKADDFEFGEERRLFYVALTRARKKVYLLTDMAVASKFVLELINDNYEIEYEEFETSLTQRLFQKIKCVRCETGTMLPRTGKNGPFFGCSHYPRCRHSENGCPDCGQAMKRAGRYRYCLDTQCEGWVPVCPDCGADMKQRAGRYGQFWGCTNYRGNDAISCLHSESRIELG